LPNINGVQKTVPDPGDSEDGFEDKEKV